MNKASKTPYEIRLELLQLSFQILQAKHQATVGKTMSGKVETSPTTEEVIAEADKMNAFISKANPSH